jgi:hypothetical protein
MWLVFDQLWSTPAAVAMKKAFAGNLRLLAQLAREPVSQDLRTAIERSYTLRETINASLTGFDLSRMAFCSNLVAIGAAIWNCEIASVDGSRKSAPFSGCGWHC